MSQIFISPQPNDPNRAFEGNEEIYGRDSHDELSIMFQRGDDITTNPPQSTIDLNASLRKDGRLDDNEFDGDETA